MILYKNPEITEMFDDEEEEYVLYVTTSSKVKMLNAVGAYIWRLLPNTAFSREYCVDDLIAKLKPFNNDEVELTTDISNFIGDMIKEGVLIVQSE